MTGNAGLPTGWYTDDKGARRYWDGKSWLAPDTHDMISSPNAGDVSLVNSDDDDSLTPVIPFVVVKRTRTGIARWWTTSLVPFWRSVGRGGHLFSTITRWSSTVDQEPRYEFHTVRVLRAVRNRAIAKRESEGWELISQDQDSLLRTTLKFRRQKSKRAWLQWAIPVAVIVLGISGLSIAGAIEANHGSARTHITSADAAGPSKKYTPTSTPTPPVAPAEWTTELASLAIKPELPLTNYARVADFGPAWADVDGQPCDTRDQILKRDLVNITLSGSCKVTSGTLHDPYTGKTINFVRGVSTSAAVQIDHVVALANAWTEGAQDLTYAQREQLANDPVELWAVDGPTNESKGDGDASQWLPANTASDCEYVEKQITVKVKYHLWVTQAEHDAIAEVLATCGGVPAATATPVPTVTPTPVPETTPAPAPPAAATQTDIHPGSYCSPQGATGTSAAGNTYVCGSKGADSSGRYHWNS
jgi:hypothetical protein